MSALAQHAERVAKAIGTDAGGIEPRLRRAERVPDGAVAITGPRPHVGAHGEEDVPAGETPATRRKTRQRPTHARSQPR